MKIVVVDGPNDSCWTKFKRRVEAYSSEAWRKTKKWTKEHKTELIYYGVPVAFGTTCAIVKAYVKHKNNVELEEIKTNYIYDPSLGHYWALRRALSTAEALELDRRHQAGERIGDILDSMKVLK